MATKYWLGLATAVAQVHTGSIDSVDATPANNTFTVTIGGVAISAVGDTDVATTATNLRASLNASTHPYFSGITWSGTGGNIIGTADTAGVPFEATLTETGAGTGAVTDFAETTASAGPCDWRSTGNWSDGVVPVSTDTVIIANNSVNICYGLDQNAVDLAQLTIKASYTGKIGLPYDKFTTSADGATSVTTAPEYREHYLKIGSDACDIGGHAGPGTPVGSSRIKWNNDKAGASVTVIHRTASTATETNFPPIRLLASHANADVYIEEAQGGVGLAVDEPNETATFGIVSVSANDSSSQIFIGSGVTFTTFEQNGGNNIIDSAATVATVEMNGGILTINGDFTITALNINDGTVYDNHIKTSGNSITTLTMSGGTIDATRSTEARTWATVNPNSGQIIADDAYITITTLNDPSGKYNLSITT